MGHPAPALAVAAEVRSATAVCVGRRKASTHKRAGSPGEHLEPPQNDSSQQLQPRTWQRRLPVGTPAACLWSPTASVVHRGLDFECPLMAISLLLLSCLRGSNSLGISRVLESTR